MPLPILIIIVLLALIVLGIRFLRPDDLNVPQQHATKLQTSSNSSDPEERRHFYLQVHGIFHKNQDGSSRQKIIRSCRVGDPLVFIPEPDNQYDSDAVKICKPNGEQLGYIPAEHAFRVAGDMARGCKYSVSVEEIYRIEEKQNAYGCKVRIGVLR